MSSSNYKMVTPQIRPDEPCDYEIVYEINRRAFDRIDEAEIVKKVRIIPALLFQYKSAQFDPYFFFLELWPGALIGKSGYVEFLPAFDFD